MIKEGDRVRMKDGDNYAYGEVTVIGPLGIKVLWDLDFDLPYWYYAESELEVVTEQKDG